MKEFEGYESDAAVAADLASKQAHLTVGNLADDVALVDSSANIVTLEQYRQGRNRKRGTFATTDIESLAAYIENNALPEHVNVFIDKEQMQAVAILNFLEDGYEQGHLDHTAVLTAQRAVVFEKLLHMHNAGRVKQKLFAEFLEDWGHKVIARDADGNEIENAKAISAVRNMRIDESAQTDSHSGNYRESRSRLESVEAKSIDGALPAYFTVTDECYQGLPQRNLSLRLAISNDDGSPVFKLEIKALQSLRDDLAKDFANVVADRLSDDTNLCLGTFKG